MIPRWQLKVQALTFRKLLPNDNLLNVSEKNGINNSRKNKFPWEIENNSPPPPPSQITARALNLISFGLERPRGAPRIFSGGWGPQSFFF